MSCDTTGNSYAAGNCTWYVKNQLPEVANSFGNAKDWWTNATKCGWSQQQTPVQNAIAVWDGSVDPPDGYGHVAVVVAVNSDNSFVVSEMNWKGLGVVDQRRLTTSERSLIGFLVKGGVSGQSSSNPLASSTQQVLSGVTQGISDLQARITGGGTVLFGGGLILAGLALFVLSHKGQLSVPVNTVKNTVGRLG